MKIIRTFTASAAALTMLFGGSAIAATPASQGVAAADVDVANADQRTLTINFIIDGVDDEIGRDEVLRPTKRQITMSLDNTRAIDTGHITPVRWGGECRVEIEVTARLIPGTNQVEVNGSVLLYEGTTTKSRDLDGVRPLNFVVSADSVQHVGDVYVPNDDEGGDWANVKTSATNFHRP